MEETGSLGGQTAGTDQTCALCTRVQVELELKKLEQEPTTLRQELMSLEQGPTRLEKKKQELKR